MKQGGDHAAGGFTIVETLIVLAVSGLLLISGLLLVNGRQNRTEFQVAINDLQLQFEQIINQTQSGFYPNNGNIQCTQGNPPRIRTANSAQGTNGQCIFVGNVLRFGAGGPTGSFTLFPLAANRLNAAGQPVSTLAEARPVPIAPGVQYNQNAPDSSKVYRPEYGLQLYSMAAEWNNTWGQPLPAKNTFLVALLPNLTSLTATGTLDSGSQQFGLYGFPGIAGGALGTSPEIVDDIIKASGSSNSFFSLNNPLDAIRLCYASGTTNQSGLLTIGGNKSLAVQKQIWNGTTCGA